MNKESERVKEWRKKNPEKAKESLRNSYLKAKESGRIEKWKKKNAARLREYRRQYYLKNKEKMNDASKRRRETHPGENKKAVDKIKARHPWYNIWINAKYRCTNPKSVAYHRYGGRGIKFKLTKKDMEYLWKRDKAHLLKEPSIDRIDNNADYVRWNCQFVERSENCARLGMHSKVKKIIDRLGCFPQK